LALEVCECQEDDVPTYQYACTACGHQLEAVQSFADEPLTVCPACEGRLRKLFSAVGVVFKGSGFYRTDSRNDTKGSSTAPAKDGGSKDGGGKDNGSKDGGSTPAKTEKTESTASSPKSESKPAATAAAS
jgi:putative FmdB family regulatory protein